MITLALSLIGLMVTLATPGTASAADRKHLLPIAPNLQSKTAQEKLDGSIRFFFGTQPHPEVLTELGTEVSSRKTAAVARTEEDLCNSVFLSAMITLQNRAKQLGANAVVNIVSYYRNSVMSSETEFECHTGALLAGVALKGDFVKIGNQ